jgi:hypothetical protein
MTVQSVRQIDETAKRYCSDRPTRLERYTRQIALGSLSSPDRGSEEMPHFDYQVRAVKVR